MLVTIATATLVLMIMGFGALLTLTGVVLASIAATRAEQMSRIAESSVGLALFVIGALVYAPVMIR
jgi:hypothetical protein